MEKTVFPNVLVDIMNMLMKKYVKKIMIVIIMLLKNQT